ncbi:5-(carboxyamino)imidazole ribonucleotide mutase [Vulcanisaeta souniana]|uniref:5-(carboxyamino)imidazole ribonucleotide mutase n=1 Tax=Vulcanisaeta souniana TaxID=164452 RepID=UPI0006D21944|nr:5-(carboxyamino)imidazole ribonucleotide mutase [Vulcanisaeta souniana]
MSTKPLVGVIMGSKNDWDVMREAVELLNQLGIPNEARVVSAHRTPELMFDYAKSAINNGLEVVIAGAGGAAHLPGMTAALTPLPVIGGVPIPSKHLNGLDSLLSIVQMPYGTPVATVAIGNAKNAALLAARILGIKYPEFRARVVELMDSMKRDVLNTVLRYE